MQTDQNKCKLEMRREKKNIYIYTVLHSAGIELIFTRSWLG